tara:strand:- start:9 stop:542 length:534 start_codon:yes stop_codon:yes gene_type:complete
MLGSKKAAIGAAMTWVVATIIIFLVTLLFVYASNGLRIKKEFEDPGKALVDEGRYSSIASEEMLLALLDTEFDGKSLGGWILQSSFETSKEDFKLINEEVDLIINNIPAGKGLGWSLMVYYDDQNPLVAPLSFGKERKNPPMGDPGSSGINLQGTYNCSIAYLGNNNVNLCELGFAK